MRAQEFIVEAKPETLGQGMLDKLFATYQKRDIRDRLLPKKFESGLEVANYIYQYVGPAFLIWSSKQYNQDQHFFLHDLPAWKSTLDEFVKVSRDRTKQIEKDINRYRDINQLRQALEQAEKPAEQQVSFYDRIIPRLNQYVENNEAKWLYQGKDYSIYYPIVWEASRELGRACDIKEGGACVTMSKNFFDSYTGGTNGERGNLVYTIAQDNVYVAYLPKLDDEEADDEEYIESEFSDIKNNHKYDLAYQLTYFPELKNIIKKFADPSDTDVQMQLVDSPEERYMLLLKHRKTTYNKLPKEFQTYNISRSLLIDKRISLRDVPRENMTKDQYYDLCKIAVNNWGDNLREVPLDLRTPELCEISVKKGGTLYEVPVPLRTPELCRFAFAKNINQFPNVPKENLPKEEYIKMCKEVYERYRRILANIPRNWRNYELCRVAIEYSPLSLRNTHPLDESRKPIMTKEEYFDLCKLAVKKDNKAMDFVPHELKEPVKKALGIE